MYIGIGEKGNMKAGKVLFLVFLTMVSLCIVNMYPVKSQDLGIIYIQSDGSVTTSTGEAVPIERDGNVYTLTDNINSYFIVVERDSIVIDGAGYTLEAQGDVGIDLSYRNNVTVREMQIGSAFYGVYLLNATRNTISGNNLMFNRFGIYLYGASQNSIIGNNATNNDIGINIESSSNNILRNNIMNNNNNNLAVYGTQAPHFNNDIDYSNTVNGKKVYYLINENNLIIDQSTFPDLGYLALVNCQNITVNNLELTSNLHGLLLAYTKGTTITQNEIKDNSVGVGLIASTGNFIVDNIINENSRGIQLSNSSTSNSIATNNISNNNEGIFLFSSSQNTIYGNNIANNDIGIGFKTASNNILRGNFFVDNNNQVYDVSVSDQTVVLSKNFWDFSYPIGGNYWSDYTGVDVRSGAGQNQTGSDGKGDTAYIINTQNKDNYPLMPYGSPLSISIVSPQNKTYTTTDVVLDFIVTKTVSSIKYSLDGQANVTITDSITLSDLAEGVHSITLYAQDTDGQTATSGKIYFTLSLGGEPTDSEAFPTELLIVIIAVIATVVVVLIYFLTRKK
jgi:parallel beta-helix repeat protein